MFSYEKVKINQITVTHAYLQKQELGYLILSEVSNFS